MQSLCINHFLALWNYTYKETEKGLTYPSCSAKLTQLKKETRYNLVKGNRLYCSSIHIKKPRRCFFTFFQETK
ncbi:hypothetical protein pE33L466_0133 (plasmid) [Bacillus cereus E33L]|uniref:Uncharacterized protein n=1 Tax=Bacillus cereus (strain ZK / E33L) TaxID=288681 RepID=Q4V1W4_BACCZ|nr:hypothetical protein pE33L466_0133 [Bacillus cereus E33L]